MAKKNNGKNQATLAKPFLTVGPTLHYSHTNVFRCWLFGLLWFVVASLFWSKLMAGSFWSFDFLFFQQHEFWRLGQYVLSPLSIFEYPWQILVLGLLMGIISVVPILVSQLLSFSYSIPFLLVVFFIANLPTYAGLILICCIATACRPLRFRSRFIAIALCTGPLVIYWGLFGGARSVEPIRWGFSFAPWICAWLTSLAIAAGVLGIGHFTRYRPGLVWTMTLLTLVIAAAVFKSEVGFAELAYQRYIAGNNPEEVAEFHDHSITEALDTTMTDPAFRRYLTSFFYPVEPILLRMELKKEIQSQLIYDRWPSWFAAPDILQYQAERQRLLNQYEHFLNPPRRWPMPRILYDRFTNSSMRHRRMPVALYYKALLTEFSPDIHLLAQKETLHFYSDYPHRVALPIWYQLYERFGDSSESIEARWRIAMHWAGQSKFTRADELISQALLLLTEKLNYRTNGQNPVDSIFAVFHQPVDSAMTNFKLTDLQRRLKQLRELISTTNQGKDEQSKNRLAKFVMLDRYSETYPNQLKNLLTKANEPDPLTDNIALAQAIIIEDPQQRAKKLKQLTDEFRDTDAGIQAMYELGLLKVRLWQALPSTDLVGKNNSLKDARSTLADFLKSYPKTIFADQANQLLTKLPQAE